MTAFVLIHGAFRGGWSMEPVVDALGRRGHRAVAPTLRGMDGTGSPATVRLADWVSDAMAAADELGGSPVVVVGHSQGGMVASAAAARHPERILELVYLDAPVARPGERGVDLSGVAPPDPLPPADAWIPPRPLGDDCGLEAPLRDWVDARLVATPLGPSLDVIVDRPPAVRARYAFCERTPPGFPSSVTRSRFDRLGVPYRRLAAPHDVALAAPEMVVELLLSR